ncbi:PrsW family intramembrane metalloprotease [candidate division WOR-3 bacterium]|nr:PrsW family intramembrane metalloprotease [candidate division WOR-3 bacterium]
MTSILLLALGPVIAIFFFFWAKDRYEREPLARLLLTAGVGAAAAIPVVIVESIWGHTVMDLTFLSNREMVFMAYVEVGFTEEFFKMLAFLVTAYWSKYMNEEYDGIMYAVAAALGFAAIENILYVFGGGIGTGILRAITAVPAHAMNGLFIGYFAGKAKFAKTSGFVKFLIILVGLIIAVLLHGTYDLIAFWSSARQNLGFLLLFPLLAVMVTVSLILIRDARRRSPYRPAKDSLGRYTGYTVSGTPLSPKIARKLKIDASLMNRVYSEYESSAQVVDKSSSDGGKQEKAEVPNFLDDYLGEKQEKDIPTATYEPDEIPTEEKEPESWPGGRDDPSQDLRKFYNRRDKN